RGAAMPYTPDKPPLAESSAQLRARIPGWGADLNPEDRPAVPRLLPPDHPTGAHWDVPERQPERWPRERSLEHELLPPVFGTACPPRGLSGLLRRYAYRRHSEAKAAHWLLLMAADRVDAWESHLLIGAPWVMAAAAVVLGVRGGRAAGRALSRSGAS